MFQLAPDHHRCGLGTLDRFPILAPTVEAVPLAAVVDLDMRRGLQVRRHTVGQLSVPVRANANEIVVSLERDVLPEL